MFKVATKTMANERTTHQQRKPPDVEEALSSMLWTPYECNGTETSSDDDVADDYNQLQHHNQSYDYDKYPHNYIAVVPITSLRATSNANNTTACYFAEDSVGQPSSLANNVATPLVPFPLTVANCSNETNATRLHYRESKNYHKVSTINALSDVTYDQATNITASANVNRTKRSYYPRYAALNKWWPASSSYRGAPTTLPSFTATPTLTTTTTGVERQPPSYESLYAIKPHSKRHHLQLLKPVLNTWNRLANTNANKNNNNIFEYNIAQQEQEQDEEQQQLDNNNVLRSTNNQHFAEESFAANFVNEDCNVETNVASTNVDNQPIINLNNRQQQQQQIHAGLYGQHCEMPPTITTAHKQEKLKLMSHTQQQPADNNTRSPQQTQENLAKFVKGNPLITKATTIKDLNDQQQQQQQQQRVVECGTDTEQVTQLQMNVFSLVEKETNSPPIKSKRDHSRKRTNQQANEYKSLFYYRNEKFVESISTSCLLELDGNKADCTSERGTDTTLNGKPNNKCLAELERLYAEFRASEQLREQQLKLNEMRLNVPARGGDDVMTAPKFNSNSCVILTDTNSVTALMKPSQLSPSLTIQVNQNNKNNNNNHNDNVIQNNNNNNSNASKFSESAATTVNYKSLQNQSHDDDVEKCKNSREAIINNAKTTTPTTTATSGICVVNCNYVSSKNSNNVNNNINNNKNNNNNNYSLNDNVNNSDHNRVTTNLTIEKIQQQQQQQQLHNTNVFMIDSYKKQNNNNLNQIQNSTNNDYNNAATVSNIAVDAMPNLISDINIIINSENDHNEYKNNDNERDQVNVIQVNETTTTATATKITAKRTFTSTECQTDDISSVQLRMPSSQVVEATSVIEATPTYMNNRDQRRHRRRERRFLHYTNSLINPVLSFNHAMLRHRPPPPPHPTHPHFQTHPHHTHLMERHSMPVNHVTALLHPAPVPPPPPPPPAALLRSMLPDILHNHFPPPYSALSLAIGNDSGHILESSGPTPTPTPITPPPPPSLLPTIQQPALVPSATASTVLSATPVLPASAITTVSNNNNLLTSVISTVPLPNATQLLHDGRFSFPLPVMRRSPSERSGKGCCGQWFAGPPLRALIAVVALGGLACALSGAALGATGLAGPPSSHLTAALLMIGVGVVLVTVSGAAWRMTAPGGPPCLGLGSSVDLGACSRRPCSRGGGAPPGLLYPEFQHRPPPPSYQASMQEYRLRLLLLDRDRQSGVVRGNSPPPTYRSHAGSLLRAPLTTTQRGGGGCGGGGGSSIAGSEYSFPPSYRSRNNTTPGTINSRRSIETEPSGRLLANEDLSEPLSVEQLSEYDSLQQRRLNSRLQSTTAAITAALHKSNNMVNNKKDFNGNVEEKSSRKGMFKLTKDTINVEENPDRITIVTITAENQNGDDNDTLTTTTSSAAITNRSSNCSSGNTSNSGNNRNMQHQAERIEILAHL